MADKMVSLRVNLLSTITIILWLTCSVSCHGPHAGLVEDVEALINRTLSCTSIQGLSISLVKNGQTVLAAGYGTRDNSYEPDDPLSHVTDNTKFCIGSITKTFTAVLLAHLLSDQSANEVQNVTWDTPVRDILGPEFKMSDWIRTNMTTIKDLLAHRMGIANYDTPLFLGLYPLRSRQEYCRRFYLLEPVQSFRQNFKYDNYMFTLVACIIERLGGASYEDLMRERLWRPLHMNDTVFSYVGMDWTADFSKSFVKAPHKDTVREMYSGLAEISPHEGAGAICTTPGDMARWMTFLLSQGRHIQPRLVDPSILCTLWVPVSVSAGGLLRQPESPIRTGWTSYGLGVKIGDYRGYTMTGHDGSVGGYTSMMMLLPGVNTGVYLSVNTISRGFYDAMVSLTSYPLDRVLDLPVWVNDTSVCNLISQRRLRYFGWRCPSTTKQHPPPKHECKHRQLENFVGQYGHRLFGNITIEHDNTRNRLNISMGRLGQGTLEPTVPDRGCFFSIELDARLSYYALTIEKKFLEFRDFQADGYRNLINYAYSSDAPPVFVRRETWDLAPPEVSPTSRSVRCGEANIKVPLMFLTIFTHLYLRMLQ